MSRVVLQRAVSVALNHATARQSATPRKYGQHSNSDLIAGVSGEASELAWG